MDRGLVVFVDVERERARVAADRRREACCRLGERVARRLSAKRHARREALRHTQLVVASPHRAEERGVDQRVDRGRHRLVLDALQQPSRLGPHDVGAVASERDACGQEQRGEPLGVRALGHRVRDPRQRQERRLHRAPRHEHSIARLRQLRRHRTLARQEEALDLLGTLGNGAQRLALDRREIGRRSALEVDGDGPAVQRAEAGGVRVLRDQRRGVESVGEGQMEG